MKRLVIEVATVFGRKILRVKEQTHRGPEFGNGCDDFVASNGFTLASQSFPTTYGYPGILYVHGGISESDNEVLIVPSKTWLENLRVAVKEYNAKFSNKPSEETEGYELIE